MTKDLAVTPDDAMFLALEECEKKIFAAFRRGIEATRSMGKELSKIRDKELYRARNREFFKEYVAEDLGWDLTSVYRVMTVAETTQRLEAQGLSLPENESQVVQLAKLEAEYQGPVWKRIIDSCQREDTAITLDVVRRAVDMEEERLSYKKAEQAAKEAAKETAKPKGVEVSLDGEQDGEQEEQQAKAPAAQAAPAVSAIRLSEKGEAALAKIRRICGDEVADAIEGLRIQISERELIKWAEEDNQTIGNLAYYVVQGWSVTKALNYEQRMIDGNTNVDTLITMCRSRGGRLGVNHDDARISVEIAAAT